MVLFVLAALTLAVALICFALSYWLVAREPFSMAIDTRAQTIIFAYTQYLCTKLTSFDDRAQDLKFF